METVPNFLNERSVALLESRWSELRDEAYVESLEDGWRIHLSSPESIFTQAGFRDSERVAPQNLLSYAKSSGQKGLVERLLAIFEHIRK